jgi:hypothetical protein
VGLDWIGWGVCCGIVVTMEYAFIHPEFCLVARDVWWPSQGVRVYKLFFCTVSTFFFYTLKTFSFPKRSMTPIDVRFFSVQKPRHERPMSRLRERFLIGPKETEALGKVHFFSF